MRRLLVLCALPLFACGRRATQADCDAILDRMVVVKLKERNITDQATISTMQADLRKEAASDLPACVGKRITDSAMACINKAETEDAVVKCLR